MSEHNTLYRSSFEHDSCGVGFIAHIKAEASRGIVRDALGLLCNLGHRGGCGAEPNTGDGAGLLTAIPFDFLASSLRGTVSWSFPERERLAVGTLFLPWPEDLHQRCREIIEKIASQHQVRPLGWREVPVDPERADLGQAARAAQPRIVQFFAEFQSDMSSDDRERVLFILRKQCTHTLRREVKAPAGGSAPFFSSLSSRTILYKGMLTADQLQRFYPDLQDEGFSAHFAMVHSRYSTNTFPSWDRAHPNRLLCHNGEINTVKGNVNWLTARQGQMRSKYIPDDTLKTLFPIIEPDCSDSANFDQALELFVRTGRSLPQALAMMIPEAWEHHPLMSDEKRAFYEYHSSIQEPWDGPASILFSDGEVIGAVLDRNGLRPSRYYVTHDDRIILASEVGAVPIEPHLIKERGRVRPGRMLLVSFKEKRIIPDDELKTSLAALHPFKKWLENNRLQLSTTNGGAPQEVAPPRRKGIELTPILHTFGYTSETMQFMLLPLVSEKRDPLGSMGNDSALACLSEKPRLLFDYFKQLFAQVTNPAIDSIREEVIMSLETWLGPEVNLLDTTEQHCRRLLLDHPILSNEECVEVQKRIGAVLGCEVLDITFPVAALQAGSRNGHATPALPGTKLKAALDDLAARAEEAANRGVGIIILSDRAVSADRVALPSLLAVGAVHQHLVRLEKRTRLSIIAETGEAREVHHHCCLLGFGADAINPYLAFECLLDAWERGQLPDGFETEQDIVDAYKKGVGKGLLKVFAKMGISTLQSYTGAEIFEAVGLSNEVVKRCFAGTPSRISGVGFDTIEAELVARHRTAAGGPLGATLLNNGLLNNGEFHWRAGGEKHMWEPRAIAELQVAARTNSRETYKRFSERVNMDSQLRCTLRGLLRFNTSGRKPIPLEDVEPVAEIVKRFATGAMSFGSISAETHETLAVAMNRLGGRSNTGEGGEDPKRFLPLPNGDSKRSAIKQVASGRFGVTAWYLSNADELQIKIAQGAKPGEGGELPGRKVDATIARIRYSTPGVGLISPPPHHDIYSIEDLKQLIFDLKNSNPNARVSVKLVSEAGVGTIAAGVVKGGADVILISGDSGGTGASPLTSIKHAGLPWELGLAETQQTLVLNDLRGRIVLQTDGGLRTGRDVVIAALLGADEFGFSTAPLITLGCIMMRKCHLNTCPVGIATQDPVLRKKFAGQPEYVMNYFFMVAEEVREILASFGVTSLHELVGRADLLEYAPPEENPKIRGLDLKPLLATHSNDERAIRHSGSQAPLPDDLLDRQLIRQAEAAIRHGTPTTIQTEIRNVDRTVGALLSHEVVKVWGEAGLPNDTLFIDCVGHAGQSFGAFTCGGITLSLHGDANDYVGKGLSGGTVVISPWRDTTTPSTGQLVIGNVALYGATSGEAFIRGMAAERFCVRNSGAYAVVEGCGDHGCEYMTGGRAVILGPTGRNFAAGMSGGFAYVWDPEATFESRCNTSIVDLGPVETESDEQELITLIRRHADLTGSPLAHSIIANWKEAKGRFVKVIPVDYMRALAERAAFDEEAASTLLGAIHG